MTPPDDVPAVVEGDPSDDYLVALAREEWLASFFPNEDIDGVFY